MCARGCRHVHATKPPSSVFPSPVRREKSDAMDLERNKMRALKLHIKGVMACASIESPRIPD